MELGERLAKIRKEKGYTQNNLANKLNVSQQVISNIERNASTPDIDFLLHLADLYRMSLDALVERHVITENNDAVEERLMDIIKRLDDTGKELSLSLVNQVAEYQGVKNGK
ncbi:helix-turn-helix domain-containing protein [Mogibacterium sp.]